MELKKINGLEGPAREGADSSGCSGSCGACDVSGTGSNRAVDESGGPGEPAPRTVVAWGFAFLTPIVLGAVAASTADSASGQALMGLAGGGAGVVLAQLTVRWLGFRGEAR